jgi:hypothetical protein
MASKCTKHDELIYGNKQEAIKIYGNYLPDSDKKLSEEAVTIYLQSSCSKEHLNKCKLEKA